MIVVSNRISVAKGHEAAFEKRFRGRAGLVDQSPGFIRNEVLRPLRGQHYIVQTYWKDLPSFEAWTQSESFRRAHADRPPPEMFSGPNVLEIHEVIETTEEA